MEKLYDTLLFISLQLNEEVMLKRIFGGYPDEYYRFMDIYSSVRKQAPVISDVLNPLCYSMPYANSGYLTQLFTKYANNRGIEDIGRFCYELQTDYHLLSDFIHYTFPELNSYDREELLSEDPYRIHAVYSRLFPQYDMPKALLSPFVVFTSSHQRAISDLVAVIHRVYPIICALHESYSEQKEKAVKNIIENRDVLDREFKLSPIVPIYCNVSILNPLLLMVIASENENKIIAGQEGFQRLDESMGKPSIEDLFNFGRGKVAADIFYEMRNGAVSVKNIMDKYGHRAANTYATFDRLLTKRVIKICYRSNNTNYYSLNTKFLRKAIDDLDIIISETIEREA